MTEQTPTKEDAYRVLARKYRPQNFEELIGQEALVRTLTNAIESGRIAHAFMLTGVRGVGKTTTARIIAKALNYRGSDGNAGPTTGATDDCKLCQAVSEDRHPDVIEMDAASRTGVEDIREILDGVRYAPIEARYKIYIIDEVHMLSKNAFNALLKTLEEPPAHVKFIFATTEIRKVPITVLSRCQRFDLRRVDVPTLADHFRNICASESTAIEEEALALIARAADGSVRDGLSLLDQAIALAGDGITTTQVQDMLGLGDRAKTLDLLQGALTGNMPDALKIMDDLYRSGGDAVTLIQDLLGLTHILTKLRAVPGAQDMKYAMAPDEVKRAAALAAELTMPILGKTWQILLKGLSEVQSAPMPQSAAEMVIIRLTYAADLPDPVDLIKKLNEQGDTRTSPALDMAQLVAPTPPADARLAEGGAQMLQEHLQPSIPVAFKSGGVSQPAAQAQQRSQDQAALNVKSFQEVVCALESAGQLILAGNLFHCVHLVNFEQGLIELRPNQNAPQKMTQDLGKHLSALTGMRWVVTVSSKAGQPTLAEQEAGKKQHARDNVLALPIMQEIMQTFPEAQLIDIQMKETQKE